MSEQKLKALGDELKRSIEKLNSEFNRNHKPLIGKIKELNDITDELESMHKNTTMGSSVGSSVGLAGGITALTGLVLAPFTFGASLALTTVGTTVGVAGGVTSAASNITNTVKQKNLRENIEKITKDFINTVNPMIELLSKISNTIKELQQEGQKYPVQNKAIMTSVRAVKTFSSVTKPLTVLQTETLKFILQMRETAAQFQETLDEIKSARDTINKELQIK